MAKDSPWDCANDLLNWLNTLDTKLIEKKDVYKWVMEWRPKSIRKFYDV